MAEAYIAGYVVNMAKKRVSCEFCQEAIVTENIARLHFVVFKSRGGLQPCCCYLSGSRDKYRLGVFFHSVHESCLLSPPLCWPTRWESYFSIL